MKKNLFVYSLSHFIVDFLCAFTIFSIPRFHIAEFNNMLFYIVLYGLLAFGTQFIFGAICDKIKKPKLLAIIGLSFNIFALILLLYSPLLATIATGLGNAMFHVGGGVISLNMGNKKATIPGIFVSTGAMGVFLGTFIPLNYEINLIYMGICGLIGLISIAITKLPNLKYDKIEKSKTPNTIFLVCFFILFAICIRSIIGFIVPFPWKIGFMLGIIFTIAVILGKALGGVLGDKIGFEKAGLIPLSISAILLSFFSGNPILGTLGIFLFNMTMPITLVIISNSLKGRQGFAFGLTTLALIIGAIPYYSGYRVANEIIIFILIVLSVVSIGIGLHFYKKIFKS